MTKPGLLMIGIAVSALLIGSNASARRAESGLNQQDAEARAKRVANVAYQLHLKVGAEDEEFTGEVKSTFDLSDAASDLTVDFADGKVLAIEANGGELETIEYNDLYITLPKHSLVEGRNEVVIRFAHGYSKTGAGLYRFKDPEDGRSYLYTDFQPYDANKLFPCFDQPDLKATYKLTAEAPRDWIVISAMKETRSEELGGGKLWTFPETLPFSTYIFSFHAGPYHQWTGKAGDVPLRLFARQSMAQYVSHKEWLRVTRQGFAFFNDYFDFAYPFGKYDQIIVPDFNAGAMENTGAVTFSERFVNRGEETRAERENRANVILHEMAHMWFGNLVTMKWWDDLWLNESFATYMASLALVEGTDFKDAWRTFYNGMKQWAYWEDGLVTTHPIVAVVPNTDQAFANFDGITYGKGASSLKQLSYFLGAENFRKGVRLYIKEHAYGNTIMTDFTGALSGASGKDLGRWTDQWLQTSGHNTLAASFRCRRGQITSFTLEQGSEPGPGRIREHKTNVALYSMQDGRVNVSRTHTVEYSEKTHPVSEFEGKACPLLVYPNHDDYDFVKVVLDEHTLANARRSLSDIESGFARMLFFQSLWDMVYDAELSLWDYARLKFTHLESETDVRIATSVVDKWINEFQRYLPEGSQKTARFNAKAETFIWNRLKQAEAGSDFQKLWLDAYVRVAGSGGALENLQELLSGKQKLQGYDIDQDRRWNIVIALNKANVGNKEQLRKDELAKDGSESGRKASLQALAIRPDEASKRRYFDELMNADSKLPMGRAREIMKALFPAGQEELTEKFADEFFDKTLELVGRKPDVYLAALGRYMLPATCTGTSNKRLRAVANRAGDLTPIVRKPIRVALQEDERCVKIRKLAEQPNKASRAG